MAGDHPLLHKLFVENVIHRRAILVVLLQQTGQQKVHACGQQRAGICCGSQGKQCALQIRSRRHWFAASEAGLLHFPSRIPPDRGPGGPRDWLPPPPPLSSAVPILPDLLLDTALCLGLLWICTGGGDLQG